MVAPTSIDLSTKSQEGVIAFYKQCERLGQSNWNLRNRLRSIDLAYQRELDRTQENADAIAANKAGDPTKFRNVTLPLIAPQVEAATNYQVSVFLTGSPIFGVVAPPEQQDIAMQYQAIFAENSSRGAWPMHLQMLFRDAFKYNLGLAEATWGREYLSIPETDISYLAGKEGKPKELLWQGNVLKRWDLYNSFFDTRVHPIDLCKYGEFAGTTVPMSRMALKKFVAELPDRIIPNIKAAFESGIMNPESYDTPIINQDISSDFRPNRTDFNWEAWAGIAGKKQPIDYKNSYFVTTLYARILPIDFSIRTTAESTPQIWKFIIVNGQVVIYAERQTNAHNLLPVLAIQSHVDGLGYQTKSMAANAEPFQAVGSALINSAMASRRRAISDRLLYDPSRVSAAHINSDNPSAKIPVRPAAYGKPLQEAVYPFPYNDNIAGQAFQELGQLIGLANTLNGSNQAKQGQFVRGNKTLHEYEDVMTNASASDQVTAILFENIFFTPLKEIFKSNILQYQPAGVIFSGEVQKVVEIKPVELRRAMMAFKVTDGLIPTDKVISADELTVALQTLSASPALSQAYNIGEAFSYLLKTRNVDLKPFEKSKEQLAYEQAMMQWQQMAQLAIEKGGTFNTPQPTPQQYGYNPSQQPLNQNGTTPTQ